MIRYIIDTILAMLLMLTGCTGAGTAGNDEADMEKTKAVLVIECNENVFYADFEDNSSAKAFSSKLESGSIEVDMHDYGSFEKVGVLPLDDRKE